MLLVAGENAAHVPLHGSWDKTSIQEMDQAPLHVQPAYSQEGHADCHEWCTV